MMIAVFVALISTLLQFSSPVSAVSSGLLPYCNINFAQYHFGRGSSVMPWAMPPQNTSFYTIRSADGVITNDPTTYTPGSLTPIHIRTLDLNRKFIGLVLYATKTGTGAGGTKVGFWSVPYSSLYFQSPVGAGSTCAPGSVVTHNSAELKPLHNIFFVNFTKGTGSVDFWIMIKQGEQNRGNFFIPAVPLTLTEAPVPFTPNPAVSGSNPLVVGPMGASCSTSCQLLSPAAPFCDPVKTANYLYSSQNISDLVSPVFPCPTRVKAGCSSAAPLVTPAAGCYFKSDSKTCPANGVTTAGTTTCEATNAVAQRICVCSQSLVADPAGPTSAPNTLPPIPTNPPTTPSPTTIPSPTTVPAATTNVPTQPSSSPNPTGPSTPNPTGPSTATPTGTQTPTTVHMANSSSRLPFSKFITFLLPLFMGLFMLPSHRRSSSFSLLVVVASLIFITSPVSAHNWLWSPSRAPHASVFNPCPARLTPEPHAEITLGQTFQIDWAVGHGDSPTSFFYFVTLAAKDYNKLYTVTTAQLDDYLNNAPFSSYLNGSKWQKWHYHNEAGQPLDPANAYFFENGAPVNSSDPNYSRDPVLLAKGRWGNPAGWKTYNFLPQYLQNDRRAAYISAKYPWIESVSKFQNNLTPHLQFRVSASFASFGLEGRQGPGQYIVHLMWGGYRDCMDISLVAPTAAAPTVKNVYGLAPSAFTPVSKMVKIDHCEFYFAVEPSTNCQVLSTQPYTPLNSNTPISVVNASVCINQCLAAGGNCQGVQLAKAKNSPALLPYPENIPWLKFTGNLTVQNENPETLDPYDPCRFWSVYNRTMNGCTQVQPKCNKAALNPADDQYVCYGLNPFMDSLLQTIEVFDTVNDASDPRYYSTCWTKVTTGGFPAYSKSTTGSAGTLPQLVPEVYEGGDQCLSCNYRNIAANLDGALAPVWTEGLTSQCTDCDNPTF